MVRLQVFDDDALGRDDVTGLLDRLRRREVSADELAAAARRRAERAGALRAVAALAAPGTEPRSGEGPLAGIPTFVKDNDAVPGLPTRQGSRATSPAPARHASPWVAQALALGLVPLGKSTMPEFGLTSTTESLLAGPTGNPWAVDRSVGGSSGGAAALVAAGVVPVAHGNDGGGSLRIPASACGLVSLKPSRGRVVDVPAIDKLPVPLVVQGVLTRTVRDTVAYLLAAEQVHRNRSLPPIGPVRPEPTRRLRIAMVERGLTGAAVDADTDRVLRATAAKLEHLGHHVTPMTLSWSPRLGRDFLRYWAFLAWTITVAGARMYGGPFRADLVEPLTADLARRFAADPARLPAVVRRLRAFRAEYAATFAGVDVMLSPVLAHRVPELGALGPDVPPRQHLVRLLRYVAFTPAANIAGTPAIAVPAGRDAAGVPIGMQLAAPLGGDRVLLELAWQLETANPDPGV